MTAVEQKNSGLVTVIIEWKNPDQAADWAAQLLKELNEGARSRALRESERSVEMLQKNLRETNLLALQQSIGRVLESELQQLTLARTVEEFAYKTVDAAVPARAPVRPRKRVLVLLAAFGGVLLGAAGVLIARRRSWLYGAG
jgi:uncharacterized protein involved in exopolysaccharide biosynthesis